jgi:predicted amidohydrolase
MVTRCLENRVWAATANRIGRENRGDVDLTYIGKSEIVSPRGEILTRMGEQQTGTAIADIDLSVAANKRINEFNDLLAGRRLSEYL